MGGYLKVDYESTTAMVSIGTYKELQHVIPAIAIHSLHMVSFESEVI
jgi:hypothetical protein